MIKDAIIELDHRIQYIMYENNSYGSDITRVMYALVTLPLVPVVIAYEVTRGAVILSFKLAEKIKNKYRKKEEELYSEEDEESQSFDDATPSVKINIEKIKIPIKDVTLQQEDVIPTKDINLQQEDVIPTDQISHEEPKLELKP